MKKLKYLLASFFIGIANLITKKDPCKNYDLQKMKEIACARDGHLWTKYNDPNKKIKDRMYCRRCGQMYHEHTYIGTQQ